MKAQWRDYLEQVTAGLKDDAELRLDVRAEMASHLADKADALRHEGVSDPESEALSAFGEVTEVAVAVERGNRRRLRRRAGLRRAMRFALIPAAVIVAIACSDLQIAGLAAAVNGLGEGGGTLNRLPWPMRLGGWLSGRHVDLRRLTMTPRQLWESDPANRTFYAECVTHEVANKIAAGIGEAERASALDMLAQARDIDPENARYDYLRAALLLQGACTVSHQPDPQNPDGTRGSGALSWEIADRSRLDEAMGYLAKGLSKSRFRRHGREMLMLRLEAMGAPTRLYHHVWRIGVSAAVLLPDLAHLRQLGRVAYLYGDTLAQEGRVAEARRFLDAWRTLTTQLNADSWTLIDCLVVTALAGGLHEYSALAYERLGLAEDAARTRREAALLSAPGNAWRALRNDPQLKAARDTHTAELLRHGGVLVSLLLPALSEWPAREAYEANRRLEYVVAMQGGLTVLSTALLLSMLGCLVVSLRWRFHRGGAVIPILLVPDWRGILRILALGVFVPMAAYAVVVWLVPFGGQSYSVRAAAHKMVIEFALLAVAVLVVPAWLAARAARRRCGDLGIACPREAWWVMVPVLALALVAAGLWFVPAWSGSGTTVFAGSGPPPFGFEAGVLAGLAVLGALALTGVGAALRLLLAKPAVGFYCGTVARSLIPVFAAAIIVLCLAARPPLLYAEQHYIAADALLLPGPGEVGFSKVENQLVERLTQAVDAAAESLGALPGR